jgi:hypothetical protein
MSSPEKRKNLGGHPVTTGSRGYRPIGFRLSAAENEQLRELAAEGGTTADRLALAFVRERLATEAEPSEPAAPPEKTNIVGRVKGAKG